MVHKKPFVLRSLVDLSWEPLNLFNLYRWSRQPAERELNRTAYQLRWRAKQLTLPYHAGQLSQRQLRRLLPRVLPRLARPPAPSAVLPFPPTAMLTFAFLERRVEMVLFRACFVRSIWEARQMVRERNVTVNGKPIRWPGFLLDDGDLVQLRADRAPLLRPHLRQPLLVDPGQPRQTQDTLTQNQEEEQEQEQEQEKEQKEQKEQKEKAAAEDDIGQKEKEKKEMKKLSSEDWAFQPVPFMSPWIFLPDYLEVNFNTLSVCFLRSPTLRPGRCEVPTPYDELLHQRTFDFYAKQSRS